MKKFDQYVFRQSIGPFLVSFFIALFVLLMQTVWVYIDDIMGRGAGLLFISEMIFYMSILMIPWALVIGILISSVMTIGNLAERYELSSMKSAGVSLLRVLMPLFIFSIFLACFSFFTADVLTPWAKLKQNARLYDIRRQKPALAIEEGVFSDNFAGYTLRIGKKDKDDKTIHDVMIYQESVNGGISELLAKGGEMTTTPDKSCLLMKLQGGHRYESLKDEGKRRFAYVRTNFEEWNKIFVVDELERTDESLFKNSQATKTVWRLNSDIDSIGKKIVERKTDFGKSVTQNFNIFNEPQKDTAISIVINKDANGNFINREANPPVYAQNNNFFKQNIPSDIKNLGTILNSFEQYKKTDLLNRSRGIVESILQNSESNVKSIDKIRESQAKHICEMHSKFVFASLCIVFLFVGAPMGAIVRKGGFGYPFIVAIGFFILFIFMYIMFRKLGEQGVLPAAFSVWIPVLILALIGAFLTKKAMYDERVFQANFGKKWFLFFKKKVKD